MYINKKEKDGKSKRKNENLDHWMRIFCLFWKYKIQQSLKKLKSKRAKIKSFYKAWKIFICTDGEKNNKFDTNKLHSKKSQQFIFNIFCKKKMWIINNIYKHLKMFFCTF